EAPCRSHGGGKLTISFHGVHLVSNSQAVMGGTQPMSEEIVVWRRDGAPREEHIDDRVATSVPTERVAFFTRQTGPSNLSLSEGQVLEEKSLASLSPGRQPPA